MIELKPGVRILGLRPETLLGMKLAEGVYEKFDAPLIITSVIDGRHMRKSEHYAGLAFDCRIHNIPAPLREDLVEELKRVLEEDFDVIWESRGKDNEHVHVEYDPAEAY